VLGVFPRSLTPRGQLLRSDFLGHDHDVSDALHYCDPSELWMPATDDVEHASIGAGGDSQSIKNAAEFIKGDRSRTHNAQIAMNIAAVGKWLQSTKYLRFRNHALEFETISISRNRMRSQGSVAK
jgi:hypothetical protein